MRALVNIFFALTTICSFAQTVKGVVSDEYGNLPFATIYFSESNTGTSSDADGNYSIDNISLGKQTVVVSYNGHSELRQKIEIIPKQPKFIKTIRSKGYMLVCREI